MSLWSVLGYCAAWVVVATVVGVLVGHFMARIEREEERRIVERLRREQRR
jgi:type III secretory pathway component EscS